jgi:predicted phosphodiesterase
MASTRFAVLGDIHGNLPALEAALAEIGRHKVERILVTGDLAFNGPQPADVVRRVRELAAGGALVVQGNTDIAVADFDYRAAFPWLDEVPPGHRAAAEWAADQLADDELDFLRALPAERRLWLDDTLLLVCHASPGSQTNSLAADLDESVTVERVTRTDARVIACGHTHVAEARELGRKLIVNPGSCGFAFDGDPAACWALLTIGDEAEPSAQLMRTPYDANAAADAVAARGLTGDVYRAATIRTGRLIR